jgi:hypothetical protein
VGTTSRLMDYGWCGKQTPKGLYPIYVQSPRPVGYFDTPPSVKPANRIAPVKTSAAQQAFIAEQGYHNRRDVFHFQKRRVLSLPPLRMLDGMFQGPRPVKGDRVGYPFIYYRSGQWNPMGWKPNFNPHYEVAPGYEGFDDRPYVSHFLKEFYPLPENVDPFHRAWYPWANWDKFPFVPLPEEPPEE